MGILDRLFRRGRKSVWRSDQLSYARPPRAKIRCPRCGGDLSPVMDIPPDPQGEMAGFDCAGCNTTVGLRRSHGQWEY